MNSLIIIELLLVTVIIAVQTGMAWKTGRNIAKLRQIIPDGILDFQVKKFHIPGQDLRNSRPIDILARLDNYKKPQENSTNDLQKVSLVSPGQRFNVVFDHLLYSLNIYLLRNQSTAADFNLMKDITERNLEIEEEEIEHTLTVPLYLGLMGTMVGIVFGLVNLYFINDSGEIDMQSFLGGVSVAMFASFWGLLCTVRNSSFRLKKARTTLERNKNDFYTFLQTELMPVVNQSIASSIQAMHQHLMKFNNRFTANLHELSGMFDKNHDALIAQENILQSLERIDITEFAKANVAVLRELKGNIEQMERFNQYMGNLNQMVLSSKNMSDSFKELLSQTNHFKELAQKLDERTEQGNKMMAFLHAHFTELDNIRSRMGESILNTEDTTIKALKQLEEHTQAKIEAIKQLTIKEEDLMVKAFSESKSQLANLESLQTINSNLKLFLNLVNNYKLKSEKESNLNIVNKKKNRFSIKLFSKRKF